MTETEHVGAASLGEGEIDRKETGIRILLTVLFALVASVIETVLSLVVVFGLLWALLTKRPPGPPLLAFANRIVTYRYRIGRYLTYNESLVPFPFSEFPESLEEEAWDSEERESESLGIVLRRNEEEYEDDE